jgi:hypothetical protein
MGFAHWGELDGKKRRFLVLAAAGIVVLYALALTFATLTMSDNRIRSAQNHELRMKPDGIERGLTPPDPLPTDGNFVNVKVGTYIDDIETLSIKDSMFSVNFYIWFSWNGPKELDPGSKMLIVDGQINKKEQLEAFTTPDGVNYQKYKISARILKFFDTARVPLESHMLNIYIEDGARDATKLRYVADTTSAISSRVRIPGYAILGAQNVVKAHTYRSTYGDPRVNEGRKTYSQYAVDIDITRGNIGVYLKIFLSLFAALALALSNFFVKPSDVGPRFSLPSAAYFGAVANSYVANSILPPSGEFGLVDFVAGFGMGTIFLTIALSLLSNYLFVKRNEQALALTLDRMMFFVLAICVVGANLILPMSAMGR